MTYDAIKELRIVGPPGCGKTTSLSGLIRDAAKQYGSDNVLVASFTKGAAVELAGRNLPLDESKVGTLHAICYRAFGQPPVAETRISEWNDIYPNLALTASAAGNDDPSWDASMKTEADAMMASFQSQRARMIPINEMEYQGSIFDGIFADFVSKWHDWVHSCDLVDFTGMIERALYELDEAPGAPKIMFLDEAQDLAPLELALARKWAQRLERLVIAGDDDQCLYSFKGADPESIFGGDPSTFEQRILGQSYRVPRTVLELADGWIRQATWRVDKEYLPRHEIVGYDEYDRPRYGEAIAEGEVSTMWQADFGDPRVAVERAGELVASGKSVMFLASCSYMLKETCQALREAGIAYHNPYKKKRADWNPLDPGSAVRKTAVYRVTRYLSTHPDFLPDGARLWDAEDFAAWATCIRSDDLFRRGTKSRLNSKEFDLPSDMNERMSAIAALLREDSGSLPAEDHIFAAFGGDLDWLDRRLTGDVGKRMKYPVQIAQNFGPRALLERPKVVVGTIHSTKGAEADAVFLYPDISRAGMDEWLAGGTRQDSVRRLFYVAMTRARESLFLCGNASQSFVRGLW